MLHFLKNKRIWFVIAWAVACFLFLQVYASYQFFYKEQMQLFLFSSDYWATYFSKPAWLACLSGDFLTQFFYFIGGGAVTVTLTLLVLGDVAYRALRRLLPDKYACLLALLIITWEALRNAGMYYTLNSTVALVGGFAVSWMMLSCRISNMYVRGLLYAFALLITYWMFGYGFWVLSILLLFRDIKSIFPILAIVVATVAVPLGLRSCYLLTRPQAYLYPNMQWMPNVDMGRERMVGLSVEAYFGNWDKVLKISNEMPYKSQFTTYFHNLAEAKSMRLADSLMAFYQPLNLGLYLQIGSDKSVFWILNSGEIWFEIGDMTMAEHSALLGQIFSNNRRSVRVAKRLAEVNLINRDTVAAQKYLRLLEKTWFHKKWAALRNPESMSKSVKEWLERKRSYCAKEDILRAGDINAAIRKLLDANENNQMALDYLLCNQLLMKNIVGFYADYAKYAKSLYMKRIYAEALLIYMAGSSEPVETTVVPYNIPASVYREFKDYTVHYEKGDTAYLKSRYGKTYWFYFHFAKKKA